MSDIRWSDHRCDVSTRVTETLTAKRVALDSLAKLLLEKEVVDRAMLDRLLGARNG